MAEIHAEVEGSKKPKEKIDPSINILVVGDWIIDEDWVMMPERSETSAKQSDERHFHTAFDDLGVATKRLCGASLTASAIRGFLKEKGGDKKNFNVFGMGIWHPKDDDHLEQLFQKDALEGVNPFRICIPDVSTPKPNEKRLFNLAREGDTCSTTRIVRTFMGHPGTLPKSMSRYDWHLEWKPAGKGNTLKDVLTNRIRENLEAIYKLGVTFDAIVLADFHKGLIDKDLILSLIDEVQKLNLANEKMVWFFRSKQIEPPQWYHAFSKKMREKDSFIQFIDPRISKKFAEGKKLIYGTEITPEGLEFLEIYNPEYIPQSKLAVLFHDNSCIAYEKREIDNKDKDKIWVLESIEAPSYITRGRSSIFLASLVIMELPEEKKKLLGLHKENTFGVNCSIALHNGIKWCRDCLAIWKKDIRVMQVSSNIREAIEFTEYCPNSIQPKLLPFKKVNEEWRQAKSLKESCSISRTSDDSKPPTKYRCLEVWRAHTILNDYTVLDDKRKENVLNLIQTIRTFLEMDDKDKKRPQVSLIKASPGSGKTFLAKCLAKHFGYELMECNLAQLTGLDGISHFFDQFDTAQRDGRKVFMFLDEVDSLVNGESSFSFLLDVMWCGQYYRNGMKNTLKPFPGLFAMSRNPEDQLFKKDHPKFPDLISRIFGIISELKNFTPVESIYLFAKLLDKYFGQIANVEKGVLKTIGNTNLKYGPRSLELLISLFSGIKRNKITIENLPNDNRIRELSEHFPDGLSRPARSGSDEKELIRIVYNAPTHK